jgi:primase-polymerase (primpol)-like protein
VWGFVAETDPESGEVSWNKPPVCAWTGRLASSTNPDTWTTFDEALTAHRQGGLDGLGFVLYRTPDQGDSSGLVGIDLDKCRNPETGAIEPWAWESVHDLNTYTEVSPSGRGLRAFLLGKLPPSGRKKGPVEMYETARYVTVTGHRLANFPATVEARQEQLLALHAQVFGREEDGDNHAGGGTAAPLSVEDEEILRRAFSARNGDKVRQLWEGDTSGYNSHSEADLALCSHLAFWVGPDGPRIADLFSRSGLHRSKWNRPDYRERTIRKALAGRGPGDFFDWSRPSRNGTYHHNGRQPQGGPAPECPPAEEDHPHLTDQGNGTRLIRRHGAKLRYCHPWRKWLVWDERRWRLDDRAEVTSLFKETIRDLFRWAVDEVKRLSEEQETED